MKLRMSERDDETKLRRELSEHLPFRVTSLEDLRSYFARLHPKRQKEAEKSVDHFQKLLSAANALLQ